MFLKKKKTFYSSILGYIQRWHCSGVFIVNIQQISHVHSVKSVHIRSYSGLYFPTFGLNMKRYGVNVFLVTLLNLSKCWLGN